MPAGVSAEKKFITKWVSDNEADACRISDAIWSYAELGMEEEKSSKALSNYLKKNGFAIASGVAGMPTAFVATYGKGKPVVGFSAEYDALPGLSQKKMVSDKKPIIEGAPGHGCGHNLLGVGSALSAVALKNALKKFNLPGVVKVFGTPAEEMCIGKPFMARAGLFRNIDAILDWHPSFMNSADATACNAYFSVRYHFRGRTSHGNSPWLGRSALDAATLTGHMIEYLRENITPGIPPFAANTVNYSFPDVGPAFPVVVPDRATIWVVGRIVTSEELNYIVSRVDKCAQAAAMATETEVTTERISMTHDRLPNMTMAEVIQANLEAIGAPEFTADEQEFARRLQKSYNTAVVGLDTSSQPVSTGSHGVSDNSEYTWFAPTGILRAVCYPRGVVSHSWGVAACSGSSIGGKALDVVAKMLAASAIDIIKNPEIIENAKKELAEKLKGRKYISLIPEGVKPPVAINQSIMDRYRPLQKKYYEA